MAEFRSTFGVQRTLGRDGNSLQKAHQPYLETTWNSCHSRSRVRAAGSRQIGRPQLWPHRSGREISANISDGGTCAAQEANGAGQVGRSRTRSPVRDAATRRLKCDRRESADVFRDSREDERGPQRTGHNLPFYDLLVGVGGSSMSVLRNVKF